MSKSKPKRRSKVNATGRTDGGAKFAMFHRYMVETEAWVDLSGDAFKLLAVLYLLHNGRNNGDLFLSVREAARRLGCSKNHAHRLFGELVDKGFVALPHFRCRLVCAPLTRTPRAASRGGKHPLA